MNSQDFIDYFMEQDRVIDSSVGRLRHFCLSFGLAEQKAKDILELAQGHGIVYQPTDGEYRLVKMKELFGKSELKEFTRGLEKFYPDVERKFKRVKVLLPKDGKLISEFAEEVADVMAKQENIFFRPDSKEVVEVLRLKNESRKDSYIGFQSVKPNRFITKVEEYIIPGSEVYVPKQKSWEFFERSITSELANTTLQSSILQNKLPKIKRIFTVPIPILYDGELTFPERGFDKRFESWLPHDTPTIEDPNMPLEEAKKILEENIFKEFCWQNLIDRDKAIAALLQPFIRGFYNRPNARTPIVVYLANRERAGKEFCANITGIVYEGYGLEEPPLSTSENTKSNNTDELRKKILAKLLSGSKRFHSANNKGFINNAVLEGVSTAEKYSDRVLGRSEVLTFDNEMEFSISGNTGIGYTPDFANRSMFIRFFLDIENANDRTFENPDLHSWIKENRGKILSALYSLVQNWINKGMTPGTVPFASFPEWARVCGGIMEAAGYANPATPDLDISSVAGDSETQDMKLLFEAACRMFPDEWIDAAKLREIISQEEIFTWFDFEKNADKTRFGKLLTKFIGRILSDVRLMVLDKNTRGSRQKYQFSKLRPETQEKLK